ncbi:hypothetical protein TELCIR_05791 [Teladorsagia circumcincta]|uniref:ISXO2-like transposase domain-containing protein n=1 Tax=Teladorsagia circumcincta TaxID=45464 RepID=A0A2G9UPR9_TELCI|nr:hypothetical protein TELCIR_05791 [Teladorsagia circumcincta]
MLTCWERRFRSICSRLYRRQPPIFGGPGAVGEVDKTNVMRRKYNRGRIVRRKEWLFGGIERGSGRAFMVLLRRRDAATLANAILKFIRPGTTIMSDSWRAYRGCQDCLLDIDTSPHGKACKVEIKLAEKRNIYCVLRMLEENYINMPLAAVITKERIKK